VKVCNYLWDHADLIDCTEYGTAVKILLQHSQEHSWKFQSRADALQTHLEGSSDFGAENPIEIEDAHKLLWAHINIPRTTHILG
jgi:hypothetical protein